VMCSYFSLNGTSLCANDYMLRTILRGAWNRSDAVVMSDCGAVGNMILNGEAIDEEDASAKALNGGMDLYAGEADNFWHDGYLAKAVNDSLTTEALVDEALARAMLAIMRTGAFDPIDGQPYVNLTVANGVNTSLHQQVAFEAALQSLVLLKNSNATLPLKRGVRMAVLGPLSSVTTRLASDYAEADYCAYNDSGTWCRDGFNVQKDPTNVDRACCLSGASIAAGLAAANSGGVTHQADGVLVSGGNLSDVPAAIALIKNADVVVMVLGDTTAEEDEGADRSNTLLPGNQAFFGRQVLNASAAAGVPVVLILVNGGAISIDPLLTFPAPSAVIEAFKPVVQGPRAIAETIFGDHNRFGKLPVT
jgi:beta-glucosidase-like glycosyl hydrolase